MATKQAADLALARHAGALRKRGAHALRAAAGAPFGIRGYVVVAWVPPGFRGDLPKSVTVAVAGKRTSVPVHVEKQGEFEPETL